MWVGDWALRGQNIARVSEEALLGWEEGGVVTGVGCCGGLGAEGYLSSPGVPSPRLYLSLVLGNVNVTLLSKQAK